MGRLPILRLPGGGLVVLCGDEPASDIHDRLAAALRGARKARGLSLDALAKLSGVRRSMASQIERGESSPTVATWWNLTQALQVDFAGVLAGRPGPGIEVVRAEAVPVISGRGKGLTIRILSTAETGGSMRFTIWPLTKAAHWCRSRIQWGAANI